VGRPGRTCGAEACGGCRLCKQDKRGYWRCDHVGYQDAAGGHFCPGCGLELGLYAEKQGWEWCGGPRAVCLKDDDDDNEVNDGR